MSRFVNPKNRDCEQLTLSNGDWIVIKTRLTNREQRKIDAAGLSVRSNPGEVKGYFDVDLTSLDFVRAETYLLEWSFKDDNGEPVQLNRSNLELLDDDSFKEIVKAIDDWVISKEEEKNAKPPETGEELSVSSKAIGA